MQYLLFTGPNSYTSIYGPLTTQQTTDLIAQFELAVGEYAIVSSLSSLPTGWESYQWGVTFASPSTVSYDFSLAQLEAKGKSAATYLAETNNVVTLVPPFMLSSQMALPEVDRLPVVNETIDTLNVLANEMQNTYNRIDAATTLAELEEINNPSTSGIISTGRGGDGDGPLDLNNSVYTQFNSTIYTESQTELFIPGTNIVLNYGEVVPNGFTSDGDCFAPGDYLVQIRVATGGEGPPGLVLAEFECPLAVAANVDVSF
jgi:hypothetical protein